jgi:hypothetical protein
MWSGGNGHSHRGPWTFVDGDFSYKNKFLHLLFEGMSRAEIDRTFVEKFYSVREKALPIESNFYTYVRRYHEDMRKTFDQRCKDLVDKELPSGTVEFYNSQFGIVNSVMRPLIEKSSIPNSLKLRAYDIYEFRLAEKSNLGALLESDAFISQTYSMDIPFSDVFGSVEKISKNDTLHYFAHRAQQTEFLFLHEFFVSYVVNLVVNNGEYIKERSDIPLESDDYISLSTYAFHLMGEILELTPEELIGLHVSDSEYFRKKIPAAIQELSLICSHIFWYFEQYHRLQKGRDVTSLLNILTNFLFIPSLEIFGKHRNIRLRADAGKLTDEVLCTRLLAPAISDERPANKIDLVRILVSFLDTFWVKS